MANKEKEAKLKALEITLGKLEKSYGKGVVMKLGDKVVEKIDAIPSGSMGLDIAMGVGGYPRGRVVEIYGPESSGKTTLTIHAIAEVQKQGGIAAFIDAEHAFDSDYATSLGVDTDNLLISQPDNGEQALEIADHLISSGAIDLVVIDSVAALTPKSEIEGEMGDSKMGLHARLMSQALRKLTATIDIRRIGAIKDAEGIIGNRTRVKVVKNKVAPPFRMAEFDIMFGKGISRSGEILDLAVDHDIINKSGSWFAYNDTKLGQGRDAVKQMMDDNPELSEEVEAKIREQLA